MLEYLNDKELRDIIQSATCKSETFNRFAKWLLFGGEGIISENNRDEQRKIIKHNHFRPQLNTADQWITGLKKGNQRGLPDPDGGPVNINGIFFCASLNYCSSLPIVY